MNHKDFAPLDTESLGQGADYYHPEKGPVIAKMDTPALEVFTDFRVTQPACITADKTIHQALEKMAQSEVHSLLVVNEYDEVTGLVSARRLQGALPGVIAEQNGIHLNEVTVGMSMVPAEDLDTINIKYLEGARVGHVVRTLHDKGVNYILVVEDQPGNKPLVRGIFSASRIGRQLDEMITSDLSSDNLADINKRL